MSQPPISTSVRPLAPARTKAAAGPNITISYEFVEPRNLETEVLACSLGKLKALPLEGRVEIVVTPDIRRSYALRVDPAYASLLDARHLTGFVTAKAVTTKAGERLILLHAGMLLPGERTSADCSLPRLLAHEGLHHVGRRRGEDCHATITEAIANTANGSYRMLAAGTLEEFRVERALCAAGDFLRHNHSEQLPGILKEFEERFALLSGYVGDGTGRCGTSVLVLKDLAYKLASVAAAHLEGQPVTAELVGSPIWSRLIGPSWDTLLRVLAPAPSILTEIGALELDNLVDAVAAAAEVLFSQIGFAIGDTDDGDGVYIELLRAA